MRVVVDTNTIISALFWGGMPWQVYQAALSEQYVALTTNAVLDELRNVRPRK
jgi:predicted nucleic acid-binding protein